MKKLLFVQALVAAAAIVLPNFGFADWDKDGATKPLLFSLDSGDGSAPSNMLSFDSESESEAQATCSMTPIGPNQPVTMEVPPPAQPVREYPYQPDMTSTPVSSRGVPYTPNDPNRRTPRYPGPPDTPEPPIEPPTEPVVPEPGTMLIIGLGIAGAALLRRRQSM